MNSLDDRPRVLHLSLKPERFPAPPGDGVRDLVFVRYGMQAVEVDFRKA